MTTRPHCFLKMNTETQTNFKSYTGGKHRLEFLLLRKTGQNYQFYIGFIIRDQIWSTHITTLKINTSFLLLRLREFHTTFFGKLASIDTAFTNKRNKKKTNLRKVNKTSEGRHWRGFGVFINLEQISYFRCFTVSLLI